MSKQIDERIVRMSFENEKFEKNVSKTMSTLDKLKEKLLLKKAGEGFDDIQKKADKISFEHLVDSVDKLNDAIVKRTGVLGTVLKNVETKLAGFITNIFGKIPKAIDQVTLDPIMTGLSEYELKINSIQVIAANTGVLMRDAMEELAKKTSKATTAADDLYSTYANGADEATSKNKNLLTSTNVATDKLQAAYDVIYGRYGGGQERREILGERYEEIQSTVNELISTYGSAGAAMNAISEAGYSLSDSMSDVGDSVSSTLDEINEKVYTMKDIDDVLEDLNVYADKTIYNYAQMTDAIGKFTVQNVDLYDSLTAVVGFSNLAAFTGTENQAAMHVMQEAAKGLASGFINYSDWMSFQTAGGMGSAEFQEQLIDTAQHLWEVDEAYKQTVIDNSNAIKEKAFHIDPDTEALDEFIENAGRFQMSLKAGWLTDKVLITTLHKYANDWSEAEYEALGYTKEEIDNILALGQVAYEAATKSKTLTQMWDAVTEAAQSSWTTTWELIFGNFYDARNVWTAIGDELSNIIDGFSTSRNAALKFWSKSPFGRTQLLESLGKLWEFLKKVVGEFRKEWSKVIGSINGKTLLKWTKWVRDFVNALDTEKTMKFVKQLADIFGKVVKIASTVLTIGGKVLKLAVNFISGLLDNELVKGIGNLLLTVIGKGLYFISKILDHINVDSFLEFLSEVGSFVSEAGKPILNFLSKVAQGVLGVLATIPGAFIGINEFVKEFTGLDILGILKALASLIPALLGKIVDAFGATEGIGDFFEGLGNFFDDDESILSKVKDGFEHFGDAFGEAVGGMFDLIGETVKKHAGILSSLLSVIGIVELVKGVKAITGIGDAVTGFLDGVTEFVEGVGEAIGDTAEAIQDYFGAAKKDATSRLVLSIAVAMLSLAVSIAIIASVPVDDMNRAVGVIGAYALGLLIIFGALRKMMILLPKEVAGAISGTLFGLAGMLVGVALSMKMLGDMPLDRSLAATIMMIFIIKALENLVKAFAHTKRSKYAIAVAGSITMMLSALIPVVIALGLLVGILEGASSVWSVIGAVVILGLLLGAMAGIMILINKNSSSVITWQGVAAIAVAAAVMPIIALSIYILIGAMNLLMLSIKKADTRSLVLSISLIVLLLYGIGMLMEVMEESARTLLTWPQVAAIGAMAGAVFVIMVSLIAFVGAIALLVAVIASTSAALGDKGNGVLVAVMISTLAMLGAIVGFIFLLIHAGKVLSAPGVGKALITLSASLLVVCLALDSLVISLIAIMLVVVGIDKLTNGNGLSILGMTMLTLAGLCGIMVLVILALGAIAKKFAGTGFQGVIQIAIMSGTLIIVAIAVSILANALKSLAQIDYSDEDTKIAIGVLVGIVAAVTIVMAILMFIFGKSSSLNLLSNNKFNFKIPSVNVHGAKVFAGIGKFMSGFGTMVLSLVAAVAVIIFAFYLLIELANKWNGQDTVNKLIAMIDDLFVVLKAVGPKFNEGLMDFITVLIEDIVRAVFVLVDALLVVVGKLAQGIVDLIIALINGIFGTDLEQYSKLMDDEKLSENLYEPFYAAAEKSPINRLLKVLVTAIGMLLFGLGEALKNGAPEVVAGFLNVLSGLVTIGIALIAAFASILMPEYSSNDYFAYMKNFAKAYANDWKGVLIYALKWAVVSVVLVIIDVIGGIFYTLVELVEDVIEGLGDAFGQDWNLTWADDALLRIGELNQTMVDWANAEVNAAAEADELADSLNGLGDAARGLEELDPFKNFQETKETMDYLSGNGVAPSYMRADQTGSAFSIFEQVSSKNADLFTQAWFGPSAEAKVVEMGETVADSQVQGMTNFWDSSKSDQAVNNMAGVFGDKMSEVLPNSWDEAGLNIGSYGLEPVVNMDQLIGDENIPIDGVALDQNLADGEIGSYMESLQNDSTQYTADMAEVDSYGQTVNDALKSNGNKFYDDTALVNKMDLLDQSVKSISKRMDSLKVYLDSGKLVGELVGPLDEALSQRAVRANRGN